MRFFLIAIILKITPSLAYASFQDGSSAAGINSKLLAERIDMEIISSIISLIGPDGAGGALTDKVIIPIMLFCFSLQFIRTMMGTGKSKGLIELVGYTALALALVGKINTSFSSNVLGIDNLTSDGGIVSAVVPRDAGLDMKIFATSASIFRSVGTESFGPMRDQEAKISDSIEKAIMKMQIGFSAAEACSNVKVTKKVREYGANASRMVEREEKVKASASQQDECMDKLLNGETSIEGMKTMLDLKDCSAENNGNYIMPDGVDEFFCNITNGPVSFITNSILIPIFTSVRSVFIWFIQLSFFMVVVLTLLFAKFTFATLPLESQRSTSVASIKFIAALGAFSFILGVINYLSAALLDQIVNAYLSGIRELDDAGEIFKQGMNMALMIIATIVVQFVFIAKIPAFIQSIASGAIDKIGEMASEAMQTGLIMGASVLPWVGAGLAYKGTSEQNKVNDIRDKGAQPNFNNLNSKSGPKGGMPPSVSPGASRSAKTSYSPPSPAGSQGSGDNNKPNKAILQPGSKIPDSKKDALSRLGVGSSEENPEGKVYGPRGEVVSDTNKPKPGKNKNRDASGKFKEKSIADQVKDAEKEFEKTSKGSKERAEARNKLSSLRAEDKLSKSKAPRANQERVQKSLAGEESSYSGTLKKMGAWGAYGLGKTSLKAASGGVKFLEAATMFATGDSDKGIAKLKEMKGVAKGGAKEFSQDSKRLASDISKQMAEDRGVKLEVDEMRHQRKILEEIDRKETARENRLNEENIKKAKKHSRK